MSESKYTTLTTVPDLVAAELIKSYLDSEGIATIIPDEHTANITWFWRNAIGGVRVQVRSEDAERARPVLQSYYAGASQPDSGRGKGVRAGNGDDDAIPEGVRLARRALVVAMVGLVLWPFLHPYSLYLSVRALRRAFELTSRARLDVYVAVVVSCLSLCAAVALAYVLWLYGVVECDSTVRFAWAIALGSAA